VVSFINVGESFFIASVVVCLPCDTSLFSLIFLSFSVALSSSSGVDSKTLELSLMSTMGFLEESNLF
jgi:hypothetical protein